jgi:2-hydroxychromene-2-carboxylate isomerase
MNDRDDTSDRIHEPDELLEKNINRRRFLLAGGAGLTAAALASGIDPSLARAADDVKRVQPRAGYTVPLPKNWVADHVTDDVNPPINEMPDPLTANVNEKNPLQYHLFLSMNSASGYLMLDRLLALSAGFNVKMRFRPILPREVLTGEEGEFPYTYAYNNVEFRRLAKFLGVPFAYPNPQVVVQDVWPPLTRTLDAPIGEDNQKTAYYISRMAAAAALQDKGEAFMDSVFRMIWDGTTKEWPVQVIPALEKAGVDGKAMDDDVKANPKTYDDILAKNASAQTATGHEGAAVAAFRQEPFPGQNRFDQLFWTLQRNGLTRKPSNAMFSTSSWAG